jgi:hypothetical protein
MKPPQAFDKLEAAPENELASCVTSVCNRTRSRRDATLIGYLFTSSTTAARPGLVEVTSGVALTSAAHRCLVWFRFGVRPAGHRGARAGYRKAVSPWCGREHYATVSSHAPPVQTLAAVHSVAPGRAGTTMPLSAGRSPAWRGSRGCTSARYDLGERVLGRGAASCRQHRQGCRVRSRPV